MNFRPYPDPDRALAQVKRGRLPEPRSALFVWIDEHIAPEVQLTDWQRAFVKAFPGLVRRTGKTAITEAIVDQAVKAGEHVHVAGHDGVRCAGGDDACPVPGKGLGVCGFVHEQWSEGVFRATRRCCAPAGHSDSPLAHDHGPWEAVQENEGKPAVSDRVTVRVLLLFGPQAEVVADVPPEERAAPERYPAAEIAGAVGVPVGDLPGMRLTAAVGPDDRLSEWRRA
ncbi:hypothetical protein [Streptomyces tendae]|uniref:hypothetical protein n=1 Tax=Streptomyces tendae TaxID=1932 RepID=UPI003EBEF07D